MVEFSRVKRAEQRIAHRSNRDLQAEIALVPPRYSAGPFGEGQQQFTQLRATIRDMAIRAERRGGYAAYTDEHRRITQGTLPRLKSKFKFATSESVITTFSFAGDHSYPTVYGTIQRGWFGLGRRTVHINSKLDSISFGH